MAKAPLNSIGSAYGSIGALNDNFNTIEEAFENTLSRDGTGPNQMEADLDMNSFDVINVENVRATGLILNGVPITYGTTFNIAGFSSNTIVATNNQTSFNYGATISVGSLVTVFVNGIKLRQSSVSFTGSTVTLPAMQTGDEVEILVIRVAP